MHLKIEKNVPQINKLEPKRAPKVASGEGQQHSAPEMSNNMSWPEMEPVCGGRQTFQENLYEIYDQQWRSLVGVENAYVFWPHFWDREFAFSGAAMSLLCGRNAKCRRGKVRFFA